MATLETMLINVYYFGKYVELMKSVNHAMWPVYPKNFHDSSDICLIGFIIIFYSNLWNLSWDIKAAFTQGAVLLQCGVALRCLVAPLIGSSWFQQAGGSLVARGKLGPWANLQRRCARFGTHPPAGKTVPCVKAPFSPLGTVPLPLTNSALCKQSNGNRARRQRSTAPRCNKTVPCVNAVLGLAIGNVWCVRWFSWTLCDPSFFTGTQRHCRKQQERSQAPGMIGCFHLTPFMAAAPYMGPAPYFRLVLDLFSTKAGGGADCHLLTWVPKSDHPSDRAVGNAYSTPVSYRLYRPNFVHQVLRRVHQVEAEAELRGWQGFQGWTQIRSHAETTNHSRKLASVLVRRWRRSGHVTRSSAWLIPHIFFKIANHNQHAFNIKYLANLIKKYWTCFRCQKLADFLVCFPPSVGVQVRRPPSWKIRLRTQLSFGFWGRAVKAFDNFSRKLAWLLKTIF